jgi:uncharacterized protein (DUF362 family)
MKKSLFSEKCGMTRREFVKTTAVGAAGLALIDWSVNEGQASQKYPYWGKVVVARDDLATDGSKINTKAVAPLLEEAVNALTDGRGWQGIFPVIKAEDKVAVKINAMTAATLITHEEVLTVIVDKLIAMGLKPGNIMIFDGDAAVSKIYRLKMPSIRDKGVRILETGVEGGEGFDQKTKTTFLEGTEVTLARIITEAAHLINVPVLKTHTQSGITFSLKNHVGSIDNPRKIHANLSNFGAIRPGSIAAINNLKAIKEKTRLIVGDSLFGIYQESPMAKPQFVYNGLIVGTDPVAVDHQARIILDKERAKHGVEPLIATHIEESAHLGVGAFLTDIKVTSLHRKKME